MKKTSIVLATTGAIILGTGLLFPTLISAEENSSDTFVQRLAEKLNLSEAEVDSVLEEVRGEHREERQVEREEIVSSALEDGSLTERQGELVQAMNQIREEERASEDFVPGEGMRNMGENHENMITALNTEGLDVTEEELDTLRDSMQEIGLGMGNGMGGGNGIGGGNGMGMGMHKGN